MGLFHGNGGFNVSVMENRTLGRSGIRVIEEIDELIRRS